MTRPTIARRVATWTLQVATWVVILGTTAVLTVAVLIPRVSGATPYTVLTGSMTPTYPPGTLVVVRPVDPKSIDTGDAITYQLESGKPAVVTHRVVSQGFDGRGDVVLRTQGDANESLDPDPVRAVQVKGEVWYAVPYLGYVSSMLTGNERQLGVYAGAAGLFGYALLSFATAARDKRPTRPVRETADV
jgi:signal peptidase